MPFLVTPGQLAKRSELYYQLSAMTKAGVGLIDAVEMLSRTPGAWSFRRPLTSLLDQLKQGSTFTEAVQNLSGWLPSFDVSLLEAGEKSGRLDACFQLLSNYYAERAQLARTVLANLAYPIGIVHLAILISPAPIRTLVVEGNVIKFLGMVGPPLLILDGGILALMWACQGRHGDFWRSMTELLLRPIPILGKARRHLALARLSIALESLLNAGVTVVEAWELAAGASGSPALRRTVRNWRPEVVGGKTPAEAISESGQFPEMFTSLYSTGEKTGTLDQTLRRLHDYYQDSATRKLRAIAQWTPRLVYFVIMLVIAYSVLSFWTHYFDNTMDAVDKAFGQ